MIRRLFVALLLLALLPAQALARGFPGIQPIATPGVIPAGATRVDVLRPVDRSLVEQAVEDVAEAWNGGGLSDLLSDDFRNRSRLFDTIAEVVPRDARLNVLAVQAVSTLEQYLLDGQRVSTVSAVVRSQIEFNEPETGFQRLEGTGEWYFRVEEGQVVTLSADDAAVLMAPPASPTPGRPFIERVDPPTLRWDSMMTVVGRNFDEVGRVVAILPSGVALEVTPVSWSDRAISIRLTGFIAGFASGLAEEPMTAVLWVCPARNARLAEIIETCGGKEIVIQPLVEVQRPVITEITDEAGASMDPPRLRPGTTVRVLGRSFGSGPRSAVVTISDREVVAEITSWSDDEIALNLPDSLAGLVEQTATLTIENDLGLRASVPVDFVPRLTTQYFTARVNISAGGFKLCEKRGYVLDFELINGWQTVGISSSGTTVTRHRTVFPSLPGAPDWRRDVDLEILDPPVPGSSNPKTRIDCEAWYDAAGRCTVRVQVIGPVGTTPAIHASESAPSLPRSCLRKGESR